MKMVICYEKCKIIARVQRRAVMHSYQNCSLLFYALRLKLSPLKQKWTSQLVSRPKKKKKQTYQSPESEMFLRGDEGQGEVPGSAWGKEK